jgi:hypothetical protein
MRFDPFDGRGVDIVIAQAIGIGGKSFRKRADRLPRRRRQRLLPAAEMLCEEVSWRFLNVEVAAVGTIPAAFAREWIGCQPKPSWV